LNIGIFYNGIGWRVRNSKNHRNWISRIIEMEGFRKGTLNFIFSSRDFIHDLNLGYLGHDYETDVITFNDNEGDMINGEIYISVDNVRENATRFSVTMSEEIRRVMAHGVLHLCGYDDNDEEEVKRMREKEEECLKMYRDAFKI
jgi:rRNA maturation RNase YbeY